MKNRFLLITVLVLLVSWAMAQPVVITPPSAIIEPGESVTLTASGALYYQWAPATGLSTVDGPVTIASPTVTTTYTCSGYAPGAESVVNGGFEQGNVGFNSAYQYNTNLWGEGTYFVDSDASLHHENFHGLGHGESGNFMIVNGATAAGTNVWTEEITVEPDSYYAFSTWVCTLAGQSSEVALLQFSINGNQIGEVFSAPSQTLVWEQFYELWYSGNSTSATITILNQNTVGSGNDFGLDDISFCELVLVGAPECTVYVESMAATATADETELCEGNSTTLHALVSGGVGDYTYSWTPANTLDDPTAQHPVATPEVGSTTYSCLIDDGLSSQSVSVTLVVHPNEMENVYETICENGTFDFYGETVSDPGVYEHHQQTQFGCDKVIYLNLENWPANDTTIVDPSICVGETYNFHGSLYDQDGQVAFFDTIDNHGCLKVEKLVLVVGDYQMPPVLHQYECYEHGTIPSWTWDKTGVTYHENTVDEIILDDPQGGCPIKHRLDLRFHETYYHEESKVACDSYYWPITGETYYASQDRIERTFHNVFGDKDCDSTFVLHLEINNYETNEFTIPYEESCDSYFWDPRGHEYTTNDAFVPEDNVYTESGTYQRTYRNQMDCDSIVTIHVDFDYTPSPSQIYCLDSTNPSPHWVVTASEFQINAYDYYLWETNPDCHWDTVTWNFEEPLLWTLEPFGENGRFCRVYVLNHVEDTIWLTAHAFNRCAPADGVVQRFWMLCSFYGVEEQVGNCADFFVAPNPNNGQMMLTFGHLTGRIDVKVYDMKGRMLDRFQTYNNLTTNTMLYDLKCCSDGIYFFVATGQEGSVTRRVVVER